jgi:hypothetical protein
MVICLPSLSGFSRRVFSSNFQSLLKFLGSKSNALVADKLNEYPADGEAGTNFSKNPYLLPNPKRQTL